MPTRPSLQYPEQEYVSALKIRFKAYVVDAKYEKALSIDITLRVMEAFKKEGIWRPELLYQNVADKHCTHS